MIIFETFQILYGWWVAGYQIINMISLFCCHFEFCIVFYFLTDKFAYCQSKKNRKIEKWNPTKQWNTERIFAFRNWASRLYVYLVCERSQNGHFHALGWTMVTASSRWHGQYHPTYRIGSYCIIDWFKLI